MIVNEIMTRTVVTVELDDALDVVKDIFDAGRFHHLLVLDDNVLVGVLSDRDLLRAVSPNLDTSRCTYWDLATLRKPVHSIMTRKPVTISPNAQVSDAVRIINQNTFSCLPVVDDSGKVLGILTWRDILKNLEGICEGTCSLGPEGPGELPGA